MKTLSKAAVPRALAQEAHARQARLSARHSLSILCLLAAAVVLVYGCGTDPGSINTGSDGNVGGINPLPGSTFIYEVTFAVMDSGPSLGALQFDAEFLGRSAGFIGIGPGVDCESLVPEALVAFNNRSGKLRVGFIQVSGIVRPSPLASCRFASPESVDVDDFEVRVLDASDIESRELDLIPDVRVAKVQLLE